MPKFDSITDSDSSGVCVEDLVASVVCERWAKVETVVAAIVPRASDGGLGVDEDTASGWSNWCCIEVKFSE